MESSMSRVNKQGKIRKVVRILLETIHDVHVRRNKNYYYVTFRVTFDSCEILAKRAVDLDSDLQARVELDPIASDR